MSKFKIGDRVKTKSCIKNKFSGVVCSTYYSISCLEWSYLIENSCKNKEWFDETDLELDCNEPLIIDNKFKIGDHVKIIGAYTFYGFNGVITDIGYPTVKIKNRDGIEMWMHYSNVELVRDSFKIGDRVKTNYEYYSRFNENIYGKIIELNTYDSNICATVCTNGSIHKIASYWLEHDTCNQINNNMTVSEIGMNMHECLNDCYKKLDEKYKKELCEKNKKILELNDEIKYLKDVNNDDKEYYSDIISELTLNLEYYNTNKNIPWQITTIIFMLGALSSYAILNL